jgi:hypothetical protein
LNVMMPPLATAATTAADVQLAGVPVPMTVAGLAVLTSAPAGGTGALPSGLPKSGRPRGTAAPDAGGTPGAPAAGALAAAGTTLTAITAALAASAAVNKPERFLGCMGHTLSPAL